LNLKRILPKTIPFVKANKHEGVVILSNINENSFHYYLGSILPTFFKQLLRAQIPEAQKDTDDLTVCAFGICSRAMHTELKLKNSSWNLSRSEFFSKINIQL